MWDTHHLHTDSLQMEFRPVDDSALTALLQQSRLSWLPKYRIISADFSKGDECIEIINTDKFHDHGGFLPRTSAAALLQLLSTGYEVKYDERSRYQKKLNTQVVRLV